MAKKRKWTVTLMVTDRPRSEEKFLSGKEVKAALTGRLDMIAGLKVKHVRVRKEA